MATFSFMVRAAPSMMKAARARGCGAAAHATRGTATVYGTTPLEQHDPEMHAIILSEQERQRSGLELIASENFTSHAVMDALGSCLTNKYSEGLPGSRYYGGTENIDAIENLCRSRALQAFSLNSEEWGVNVQPYSGSPANFAVYTALLEPHDRVMGLDLPSGGHLTHGYYITTKAGLAKSISATSTYFESLPYTVNVDTGLIDYDELQRQADIFKPRMLICGASAYPREYDYARFREIADSCGAYFFCDVAHSAGLIAGGIMDSPFEYADVVTSTTHKSLRGPRSGIIFAKKELMNKINFAVFPSLQGGPHNHQIAAVATQLKEVCDPSWKDYCNQVVANTQAMTEAMTAKGHVFTTGGTSNHLAVWDLRPHGVSGSKFQDLGDAVKITVNKNTIHGDANAVAPAAVRIGSCALTSRGLKEPEFVQVAEFLGRGLELAKEIQDKVGKPLKVFRPALVGHPGVEALRTEVEAFSLQFPMPGKRWE